MRTAEETLLDLNYLRSDHEIDFNNLKKLVIVIRKEMLINCICIVHENAIAGCHEFTELQLKHLLDKIK